MGLAPGPQSRLASKVLPPPLYAALTQVFSAGVSGCMLAGGRALAGYYAGHRRSDDLDLFTDDEVSQEAAVLAMKALGNIGALFADERSSAQFYHTTCRLDDHDFTAQVVLNPNLHAVGSATRAGDGFVVADLWTLLKMKAARLVSRGGEKDLYDRAWLFEHLDDVDVPALIVFGKEIDGGVNAESILINLIGTELARSACDFSLSETTDEVFSRVSRLKEVFIDALQRFLKEQPRPPIGSSSASSGEPPHRE